MSLPGTVAPETLEATWSEAFRPDPILTVSEWADAHRILDRAAAAEPGRFRTDRTPYLREIMDVLSTHRMDVNEVYVAKGAQLGFTEAGNNWIGYVIDSAPGPMLAVMPKLEAVKRNSKTRVEPLINSSPRLRAKVRSSRERDSGNTQFSKNFPGGVLHMVGANSASDLRSMPIRYLFLDEIDGYPGDLDGEGDPVEIAKARTSTYRAKKKIYGVSTPTTDQDSRIWPLFVGGDQRRYHVPCPHCGHRQHLVMENLRWKPGEPRSAMYECSDCHALIPEHAKTEMLRRGEWVPEKPDAPYRSYHINSLYSPLGWESWSDMAQAYEAAMGNNLRMKTFQTLRLGLPFAETGDVPKWELLYQRRSEYEIGVVPKGAYALTAGVDVQGDRLEMEVVAWGLDGRSWSVDYQVIQGDTKQPATWAKLTSALTKRYPHEEGGELGILRAAVDTGYQTQTVYKWAQNMPANLVVCIKGTDNDRMPLGTPRSVQLRESGRTYAAGLKVWPIGVPVIKGEIYSNLGQVWAPSADAPVSPAGWCEFPEYAQEYFEQLTAEEMRITKVRGYTKYVWVKTRPRNEALDCRCYARAAAIMLGVDNFDEATWSDLRAQARAPIEQIPARPEQGEEKPARRGYTDEDDDGGERRTPSFWS